MADYNTIIVGAGPSGLFAALTLAGRQDKILVVEEGKDISDRTGGPEDIMSGVGGAGLYSDGMLNLNPDIGGSLSEFCKTDEEADNLVRRVDEEYLRCGAPDKTLGDDEEKVRKLREKASSTGINFIPIIQRHIGTDNAPKVISRMKEYLSEKGVEFLVNTRVEDILVKDGCCGGVMIRGREITSDSVILAPGRVGADWGDMIVHKHRISSMFRPIDVGVRVEVGSAIMDDVASVSRDPKFHIHTSTYNDFVRTFCTNHQGYVVEEKYDGFTGVNGHTLTDTKSENTNFAFLVRIALTEPVEDTIQYGEKIAMLATMIGGGRPIIQRLGNLREGRRSHPRDIRDNGVRNTLKNVTPGDVGMALPHRIVTDILEGLEKLGKVIPGVDSDSTLLYAPEIKYYSMRAVVDGDMMTSMNGLYAAGDGMGLSRDIVNASATGILAAEGVLRNEC
ncbi:MAG: NAD(P)/FAD-dependent oxidoreductase [Candidatus Altiarchaeota archaeon]